MSNYQLTTLKTIFADDGNIIIYDPLQAIKYFHEEVFQNILNLSDEEKHRWFSIHKEHEELIKKTWTVDDEVLQIVGDGYSLSQYERMQPQGVSENILLNQYREWLSKQ